MAPPTITVTPVETDNNSLGCFDLGLVVRPHFTDPEKAIEQIVRQRARRPAIGVSSGHMEKLLYARFVNISDLEVTETGHKTSVRSISLEAIAQEGAAESCVRLIVGTALTRRARGVFIPTPVWRRFFNFARSVGEPGYRK